VGRARSGRCHCSFCSSVLGTPRIRSETRMWHTRPLCRLSHLNDLKPRKPVLLSDVPWERGWMDRVFAMTSVWQPPRVGQPCRRDLKRCECCHCGLKRRRLRHKRLRRLARLLRGLTQRTIFVRPCERLAESFGLKRMKRDARAQFFQGPRCRMRFEMARVQNMRTSRGKRCIGEPSAAMREHNARVRQYGRKRRRVVVDVHAAALDDCRTRAQRSAKLSARLRPQIHQRLRHIVDQRIVCRRIGIELALRR
jgi:hypothetical protein